MNRENYDGTNVCNNQDDFNVAVRKAIKKNNEDAVEEAAPWIYVYIILWMIFFVWAVMIAMKKAEGPDRVMHLVMAMVFSPAYVLANYLGEMMQ